MCTNGDQGLQGRIMPDFGLNQVTMARSAFAEFIRTAARLGCVGVELRNDLGRPFFDGMSPTQAGTFVHDHNLRILGLSQVNRFNYWSQIVADELKLLIEVAEASGAETISLIPCNDSPILDPEERRKRLVDALESALPFLEGSSITAMIEPLGFASSSLRHKTELASTIEQLGIENRCKMVHDTFHHTLAGGGPICPNHTHIVHLSGVVDATLGLDQMEDAHRVLVDDHDQLGNLEQVKAMIEGGFTGVFSFECFAPEVHTLTNLEMAIDNSMRFVTSYLQDMAA